MFGLCFASLQVKEENPHDCVWDQGEQRTTAGLTRILRTIVRDSFRGCINPTKVYLVYAGRRFLKRDLPFSGSSTRPELSHLLFSSLFL